MVVLIMKTKFVTIAATLIIVVSLAALWVWPAFEATNNNPKINDSGITADAQVASFHSNQLNVAQMQLEHEFYHWYHSEGYTYGPITNASGKIIFNAFITSNATFQEQLNNIANLETKNALQNNGGEQVKIPLSDSNSSADPFLAFNIIPIKLPWYLGGFTVGDDYYYYIEYSGSNALYYYQGIQQQLSEVNLAEGLSFGFGAGIGAAVALDLLDIAEATTIVGLIVGAIITVLTYALLQSELGTLNSAFDSTYVSYNYFETVWEQTVFLDGVSDAMSGYAWNANTGSFQTIYGPLPELPGSNLLNGFETLWFKMV